MRDKRAIILLESARAYIKLSILLYNANFKTSAMSYLGQAKKCSQQANAVARQDLLDNTTLTKKAA